MKASIQNEDAFVEDPKSESAKESSKLLEPNPEDINLTVQSVADILATIDFGRCHILTMVAVFVGYSGRHALLDMMPVLSTRLYVEMNLTPELESSLATVTFVGMALSYIITGVFADAYGRRTCAIWGTVWIVFWNTLCAISWNIESLIAFRML